VGCVGDLSTCCVPAGFSEPVCTEADACM
jgi:hypothetical protein